MAITWGTGLEFGPQSDYSGIFDAYSGGIRISAGGMTGSYVFYSSGTGSFGKNIPGSVSEYYLAGWCQTPVWVTSTDTSYCPQIGVTLTDNKAVYIKYMNNTTIAVYVDSSVVLTATNIPHHNGTWRNVQMYVKIADSGGRIVVKIDGSTLVDYTGDTKPGSTAVIQRAWWGAVNDVVAWDDVCMGDDWPGDVRFSTSLKPVSDASVAWTPSTGTTHYTLVDEAEPSDTDYVSSSTNGQRDLFDLTDWVSTGKIPVTVGVYARAKRDTADTQTVNVILKSDTVEGSYALTPLTTYLTYMAGFYNKDPNGNVDWTAAAINALQAGIDSVIP